MWGIAPHDPALDALSDYEMELDVRARWELEGILSGRVKAGPTSDFNALARERIKQMQEQAQRVTADELWGGADDAGSEV